MRSDITVVRVSRAVADAHLHRHIAALALVDTLDAHDRLAHTHRLEAVRGAICSSRPATRPPPPPHTSAPARGTASRPEQLFPTMRAAHVRPPLANATRTRCPQ